MKFKLEIELGNDAMQTGDDLAELLQRISIAVRGNARMWYSGKCPLHDRNGNTVGKWEVK